MRQHLLATMFVLGLMGFTAKTAEAGCPPWRPCGPGLHNWLIPQGAFGADFRPACAQHDACYTAGCNRKACDCQFRATMHQACECSRHPALCRMRANAYYTATRLFGGLVY